MHRVWKWLRRKESSIPDSKFAIFASRLNDSAHAEQRKHQGNLKLRQVTYGRHAKNPTEIENHA